MMDRRPLLHLTVAAALACPGCDLLAPGEPYDGRLAFAIREGHYVDSPPPPHIALIVTTEKEYSCANFHIESEFSAAGNALRVAFSGRVLAPNVCLTAIGPAQYRVALPVTAGTYTLEFTRDAMTDRYAVTVTDAAIAVATIRSTFTRPAATVFPRGG